ncbi:hypothetical protein H0274_14370 [Altererythrobacter sp. CC-YST694]|uniref:DUF2946 family protein n=1 Tax=Altererythrobacter sp. CC-YST694 TaxID=2755038 RepID=UPI001D0066AA|nr:DUF2946 family protein [Altererythrobacter sp. CC-YST694]MCB5426446.1 hypothetical protein [Altererythrobacter sp. CC-YST694]
MTALRAFLSRHRILAIALVMTALCMKALIPTGFMLGQHSRVLTVEICSDSLGHPVTAQLVIPVKDGHEGEKSKGECPYSSLAMASLTGTNPALLALALAFVLALGFAAPPPLPTLQFHHARPPLRGPPAPG